MDGASTPAPGWYPDPAGSSSYRWWDGGSWTAHLRAPEPVVPVEPVAVAPVAVAPVAAPAPPAPTAPIAQPAPSPVVASVATEYVGDPRFGGPAPAVDLSAAPTPAAPPAESAGRLRPSTDRPRSHYVVAAVAALAVLLGAVLAGRALLGGNGATAADDGGALSGGLLAQGNPRVVAMRGDVLSIANAEENIFAGSQTYAAVKTSRGSIVLGGHTMHLATADESVQIAVSPSGTGFCVRASRTPAGGGADQVLVYISTQGGFQPPTVGTCPATF